MRNVNRASADQERRILSLQDAARIGDVATAVLAQT